ncbi:L-aspartate oxidase [Hyphobacterium marinum]|uniref:L-aspartate oxidase n=1 Tax=Hyphobacterium marinum TaxID=3116574 RepID=A0ABU7M220_9PROT|nr:L-aspartate oxidase [Hyphobacterium sp. Y6023]MEE2567460.1 L-aspartate oxidase [Hyphobacterium sp. Y6023]
MTPPPILIAGAGIAGLWAALNAAPRQVLLLTGSLLGSGTATGWAQGGVAGALGPDDAPAIHAHDTVATGDGLTDPEIADLFAQSIPEQIRALAKLGVPFETTAGDEFALGLEAAHARRRVAHVKGDQAGGAILSVLIEAVRAATHITILDGWRVDALLPASDGGCGGVLARRPDGTLDRLEAAETVLAMGGAGGLYETTTSPKGARGQAMAMAHRIGADILDPEFIQFHPTAIDAGIDPAPLATEALRGDGAILIDRDDNRLMAGHPQGDLAPRDAVARAVHRARMGGRGPALDARGIGPDFPQRFPSVFAACAGMGLDPRETPIPVLPAAHYTMGGIATDRDGRTSLPGLWAIGECAASGLHGANRLASNSLGEGLVFGARVAEALRRSPERSAAAGEATPAPGLPPLALTRLRQAMSRFAGVERDEAGLRQLIAIIDDLAVRHGEASELVAARLIARGALSRRESRGGHFRRDFPAKTAARHTRFGPASRRAAKGA